MAFVDWGLLVQVSYLRSWEIYASWNFFGSTTTSSPVRVIGLNISSKCFADTCLVFYSACLKRED